jgi:regulatory protein
LIKQYLTAEQAFQKGKHFCSYQERCHVEVKEKLYAFGLKKQDVELVMSRLIEDDYLNEERYAQQFAGGKFRIKQWGRVKIKYELKQKKISDYIIKKAFKEIDELDYTKTLKKLTTTKWNSLKNEQYINRQVKTTNYLLQKGFELNLIKEAITNIQSK